MERNQLRATLSLLKKIQKRSCFALTSIDLFGLSSGLTRRSFSAQVLENQVSFNPRRLFSSKIQRNGKCSIRAVRLHTTSFSPDFVSPAKTIKLTANVCQQARRFHATFILTRSLFRFSRATSKPSNFLSRRKTCAKTRFLFASDFT